MEQETKNNLTLMNIFGGAVPEHFQEALKDVLENIEDSDCDWDATREITIKMKFKGNQERDVAWMGFQVIKKLAPLSSVLSQALISVNEDGEIEAHEIKPQRQRQLPLNQNVTPINREINADA